MAETNEPLIKDGRRIDGRAFDELRPIEIKAHVLNEADGSAYIRWGNNKVIVGVYGPKECIPKHMMSPFEAIVRARYNIAPFASKEGHGRAGPSRRSIELSKVISEVFRNVIMTEYYPRTEIDIFIDVLQGDGGTRCAGITAASVALADAGIPMKDMVVAVAGGVVENTPVIDLNYVEDSAEGADIAMAFSHRTKEILLLQMEGNISPEQLHEVIKMGLKSSEKIYQLQRRALERIYTEIRETNDTELEL